MPANQTGSPVSTPTSKFQLPPSGKDEPNRSATRHLPLATRIPCSLAHSSRKKAACYMHFYWPLLHCVDECTKSSSGTSCSFEGDEGQPADIGQGFVFGNLTRLKVRQWITNEKVNAIWRRLPRRFTASIVIHVGAIVRTEM